MLIWIKLTRLDEPATTTYKQKHKWIHVEIHFMETYCTKETRSSRWFNLDTPQTLTAQIAKFMGQTWGPPGSCRPQMGPMLAPWTLISGSGWFNVGTVVPTLGQRWTNMLFGSACGYKVYMKQVRHWITYQCLACVLIKYLCHLRQPVQCRAHICDINQGAYDLLMQCSLSVNLLRRGDSYMH